jgi:excisionase family DNA binding protein
MATDTVRLLTVIEVADHLCLSRSKVYELLADGSLPSVRIGRTRRIAMSALADFIARHSETAINGPSVEPTAALA